MRKSLFFLMVVLFAALLLLAGCGSKVVATVNGENITQQELDKQVEMYKTGLENQGANFSGREGRDVLERLRQDILKQLIDEKLLLQEVKKKGLEPSSGEVQQEIKKIKESFESEGQFKKFLAASGINEPQLEDYIKKQLAIKNLIDEVTAGVTVSADEVKQYYRENEDKFTEPEKRKARHILVEVESNKTEDERAWLDAKIKAMRLLEEVKQGADFAQLAKEKSEDQGTKDSLLTVTRGGGFVKEFEDAVFALKEGEVTQSPVKTQFGYHIIKLEEIIPSRVQPFEEVKDQIKAELEDMRRAEKFADYMENLRKDAKIENKLSNNHNSFTKK